MHLLELPLELFQQVIGEITRFEQRYVHLELHFGLCEGNLTGTVALNLHSQLFQTTIEALN